MSGNDGARGREQFCYRFIKSLNDSVRLVVNEGRLDSATGAQILFSGGLKCGSDEAAMVWGIIA